ncbi:MAG TPA: hypothetical protein VGL04_12030 [Sporichthyaceae bacterium]|jgi:hypothetical protein
MTIEGKLLARRGNFGYRSVASSFEFAPEDFYVDRTYYGLGLLGAYFYSSLHDAQGNILAPMRKVTAEMGSGLQLQTNVGRDFLETDLDSFLKTQRGVGIRWAWEGPDTFSVRAKGSPINAPADIVITPTSLSWSEGDLVDLHGERLGLGYQWYTPNLDEGGGNYYASQVFHARGTVLGREVEGIIGFDELYGPQGQVFQTSPCFNGIELAWVAFANVYPDGEFEVGACCLGAQHWGFAVINTERGEHVAVTDIEAEVTLDDDRYAARAVYHLPGEDWVFTAAPRAQMRSLAAARGDNYHGQGGSVRRAGDDRTPTVSTAWIETFPANGVLR